MHIKRLSIIIVALVIILPGFIQSQEAVDLTAEDISEYSEQSKQLVKYLEGTLNFLGDPAQVPAEKDIIINESFLKMFQSDETQIEDDLDPTREMAMNKDVQAYFKDVVFFFKSVKFTFEVNAVEQKVNEAGQVYFKVTMNRNLQGVTITNDSLNNNQIRYMEINLNPIQKDLKIASLYTTKPNRRFELKYWWENMAENWRKYFGDSIFIYRPIHPEFTDAPTEFDTIAFWEILSFSDTTLVRNRWHADTRVDTMIAYKGDTLKLAHIADSLHYLGDTIADTSLHYRLVYDTLSTDGEFIYSNLEAFVAAKEIDLSGNKNLSDLKPLTELNGLITIDFSNTLIKDISPLRNLNKLEMINCNGSKIESLDQLRFASKLIDINCGNTNIINIDVLANLKSLNKLNLSQTKITDISALGSLKGLTQLNLSGTDVNDFSALSECTGLSDLNLSGSSVTDLTDIGKISSLQNLNIDSTYVTRLDALNKLEFLSVLQANSSRISNLDPLSKMSTLKLIYCDNTGIDGKKARKFMSENSHCLVIYNTKELEKWWINLPPAYTSLIHERMTIDDPITTEQLHQIINLTEVNFSGRSEIKTIEPLKMLHRLEKINLENTMVSDLEPLAALNNLMELNIKGTQVDSLMPLKSLNNLKLVKCEYTSVSDLMPLANSSNLHTIYCDSTQVSQRNVLLLREELPNCLVIYQSEKIKQWWSGLSSNWQDVFIAQMKFDGNYDAENLQKLVNLTTIVVMDNPDINDIEPLSWFMNLEKLTISNTRVNDISPLVNLKYLEELNLPNNPIFQVEGITGIKSLNTLNLENTPIEELDIVGRLSWLTTLNIAGTKVKKLKGIEGMASLEVLMINNTVIKSLKGLESLEFLKELKCYRTGISSKNIDKFKVANPDVDVEFY